MTVAEHNAVPDGKAVAELRAQIMASASQPSGAPCETLARLGTTLLYHGNSTMRTVKIPGVGKSPDVCVRTDHSAPQAASAYLPSTILQEASLCLLLATQHANKVRRGMLCFRMD